MNTQAIMIDKNAFEEKELWASFLNFSNNVFADIQSYPENKLAECEVLGIYPALEFILQGISGEYDFYNLPINGFYENSQGTIFDYGKKPKSYNFSRGNISLILL
jgi:c-di-GMP-related signal transduction protein